MDWESIAAILSLLLGGGGIVAWLKARSEVRNNNKSADVAALEQTIKTLQNSYKELQDRYQETIGDYKNRCDDFSSRIQFLETEYVKQTQLSNEYQKRISELEIELNKANHRIEFLENQLNQSHLEIQKRDMEILELRRKNGERVGLETK